MSKGFSKKPTMAGSFSREARTLSSVTASFSAELLGDPVDWTGLLGSCNLRPTSSILRSRLVTWATMLYRVFENWMN
uniref:Uncharacterized protein n=1 Tax=Cynoglossus semilaevis TaxID=244447 RepID=A0A3P8W8P7_CYNSE